MTSSSAEAVPKKGGIHILEEQVDEAYEPTSEELRDYAQWLGMDPDRDDLLWIARKGLKTPLPKPWRPCEAASGDIFFYNPDTGASQWDHPCDDELRKLYAAEVKRICKPEAETAPSTPCNDLASVSSIGEECSPQRLDDFTEKTPSPAKTSSITVPSENRGLAALAASAAKANAESSGLQHLQPSRTIGQPRLVPERPSRPPPAKLRPPRPKPSPLEGFDEPAFCRSPAKSPEPHRTEAGRNEGERVMPGDVQSPPTPRLSAVLKAELCSEADAEVASDQISLWSRLEDGEETPQISAKAQEATGFGTHSLSNVQDEDSLEISSLTAVLEQSNLEDQGQNTSELQAQTKLQSSASPASPWLSPAPEARSMVKLRQLREQLESKDSDGDKTQSDEASHPLRSQSQIEGKEDAQQSHEKPVQDSTTQTDETTAASASVNASEEHLLSKADSPGVLSEACGHDSMKASEAENSPPTPTSTLEADALAVQQSMACLAAELNAASARKPVGKAKVHDLHSSDGGRFLRDITNEMRDAKAPSTPRSVASLMDIANMRMQLELQEQQRSGLERQLDECLSTASMEQASHAATKAALRESQREVLRLQSQVQFKDAETQRLEMELQRCQSELASLSSQSKQAQVQLKSQQAELCQLKMKLKADNAEQRPSRSRAHSFSALSPAPAQELKGLSEVLTDEQGDAPDFTARPLARSSHRSASGTRLQSEVSEALRKRRKELRRQHAELEKERSQWRLEARTLRSRSSECAQAEDLVRARAELDSRASTLNQSICEYRALQRALTSGSLHPDGASS